MVNVGEKHHEVMCMQSPEFWQPLEVPDLGMHQGLPTDNTQSYLKDINLIIHPS